MRAAFSVYLQGRQGVSEALVGADEGIGPYKPYP